MRKLLRSFRRFCSGRASRAGNVAIIFGLTALPIVGAVGAAVDYSMANSNRSSMQKALDATALALAKQMPMSQADLNSKGWQFFSANLGKMKVAVPQAGLVITQPVTGKLHLVATGDYEPQISGFMGIKKFPVAVNSTVQWGMKKLELALALDNTGSMASSNKMTELKKAAKSLLTTLKNTAKTNGDVKVSIIPFNTMVNTGQKKSTNWIKKGDWDSKEGHCTKKDWWGNSYYPKSTCEYYGGDWQPTPYTNGHFKGCVEDRDKENHLGDLSYDAKDKTPEDGKDETKFPARVCPGGLTTLLPLTYDWTALNNKVDDMDSDGNTNVTIGLVWAWHSLTGSGPLTEGAAASTDLNKIIILMTDGDNTQNRWSSNEADINARTALACTNIKNSGIQIYSIRVIDGNSTLLRNCASDPSMYYDVQNASQLTAVFNSIGSTLAKLHLSE
jgi:Flp pilus assembly protein TadG